MCVLQNEDVDLGQIVPLQTCCSNGDASMQRTRRTFWNVKEMMQHQSLDVVSQKGDLI